MKQKFILVMIFALASIISTFNVVAQDNGAKIMQALNTKSITKIELNGDFDATIIYGEVFNIKTDINSKSLFIKTEKNELDIYKKNIGGNNKITITLPYLKDIDIESNCKCTVQNFDQRRIELTADKESNIIIESSNKFSIIDLDIEKQSTAVIQTPKVTLIGSYDSTSKILIEAKNVKNRTTLDID